LNRSCSSESDLSSLSVASPSPLSKSKSHHLASCHSFHPERDADMTHNPDFSGGIGEQLFAEEGEHGLDDVTMLSVPFELSDCDSLSLGTSVNQTQHEQRSTIIITPTPPASAPMTPTAAFVNAVPNCARPSAVKWSEDLFVPMPDDALVLPSSLAAVFDMDSFDMSYDSSDGYHSFDLETSPATMKMIDETIDEIFGDEFTLSGSLLDTWDNSVEAWENLANT
jgi:hypothetical protein